MDADEAPRKGNGSAGAALTLADIEHHRAIYGLQGDMAGWRRFCREYGVVVEKGSVRWLRPDEAHAEPPAATKVPARGSSNAGRARAGQPEPSARQTPRLLWADALRSERGPAPRQRLQLLALEKFMNPQGFAYPSQATIAQAAGTSEKTTRAQLRAAEAAGWIQITARKPKAGWLGRPPKQYQAVIPAEHPEVHGEGHPEVHTENHQEGHAEERGRSSGRTERTMRNTGFEEPGVNPKGTRYAAGAAAPAGAASGAAPEKQQSESSWTPDGGRPDYDAEFEDHLAEERDD